MLDHAFAGHLTMNSKENEVAAWRVINRACDLALEKYPTAFKEDL